MPDSSASVTTERPARYAKQLASHLLRRLETSWDDETGSGWVELGTGRASLTAGEASLDMRITDADDLDRFEDVLGRHLVRFGAKDELVVQWTRDDGTPGTSYRNDG